MKQLRPCDGCARHVFADEVRCPFCAKSLGPVASKLPLLLQAGLSRAQRYAIAAAVAGTAVAGCSKHHDNAPGTVGAPSPIAGAGASAGTGGASSGDDEAAGSGAAGNGRAGNGGAGNGVIIHPMYGGGVPIAGAPSSDAGAPDAGGDDDAGRDEDDLPAIPVYGAPFP